MKAEVGLFVEGCKRAKGRQLSLLKGGRSLSHTYEQFPKDMRLMWLDRLFASLLPQWHSNLLAT